jgi:hypothetical protein
LMAKYAARAGPGAVGLCHPMRVDMAHEIFVGRWDGVGGGQALGEEFKGLASRHCEARRAVAVKPNPYGLASLHGTKFKGLKSFA